MKKIAIPLAICASVFSSVLIAKDPDARLAIVRKAFVVAKDDLGDDKPIAACLASTLSKSTPLTAVDTKEEADVILTVSAHLVGDTSRTLMGDTSNAFLRADAPAGTFQPCAKDPNCFWSGSTSVGASKRGQLAATVGDRECQLAGQLADSLRQAMRKARDNK